MATVQGPIPASFKASMRHELANSISSSQSALHFSQDLERQFVSHHKSEPNAPGPVSNTQDTNLLVVSPYTAREHLLDLRPLQTNQQLLAKALTTLLPVTEQYATASYQSSFNWATVVDTLRVLAQEASFQWADQSFYIVVFRSQIPPTTDRGHLAELDRVSHMEATKSGGLLKYWFGVPDADGRNLATCIWRDYKDARPASSGQGHKNASRATISMYKEWHIERLRLVIRGGKSGSVSDWTIIPWQD